MKQFLCLGALLMGEKIVIHSRSALRCLRMMERSPSVSIV